MEGREEGGREGGGSISGEEEGRGGWEREGREEEEKGEKETHEEEQPKQQPIKVAREETEVVVRGGGHAVQYGRDGVEDEHRCCVCY